MEARKVSHLQGHRSAIYALSRFSDEQHFLTAGGDGLAVSWNMDDPENGKLIAKVEAQIFSLGYFHKHQKLALGNMNGGIHFIDLREGKNIKNVIAHEKGVFRFLDLGDSFISIGGKGNLIKWNLDTLKAEESLLLSGASLRGMAYHADRKEIAIGASDHHIYFLDAETLAIKNRIKNAHENSVFSLIYHPNGTDLLSGGRDAQLRRWNLENLEKLDEKPAHWFTINDMAIHPNGHLLATASRDKSIKIWDTNTLELQKVLDLPRYGAHANSVNALYWSSYRETLVSVSDDRSIALWEFD